MLQIADKKDNLTSHSINQAGDNNTLSQEVKPFKQELGRWAVRDKLLVFRYLAL